MIPIKIIVVSMMLQVIISWVI